MENQNNTIKVPVDSMDKATLKNFVSLLSNILEATRKTLQDTREALKEQEQEYLDACTKVDELGDKLKEQHDYVEANLSDMLDKLNDAQIGCESAYNCKDFPSDMAEYARGYYEGVLNTYLALAGFIRNHDFTEKDVVYNEMPPIPTTENMLEGHQN